MKKIIYILTAAICLLTSCEKELTLADKLVGDWHCTATSTDAEIYVTFTAEKTFTLYQQIGEGAFRVYNGTYALETSAAAQDGAVPQAILTGDYNDGTPWGAAYAVDYQGDDILKLTAEGISETYNRVSGGIPEEVKASSVTVVRSAGPDTLPFL